MVIIKRFRLILVHAAFVLAYIINDVSTILLLGSHAGFWDFAFFLVEEILFFYFFAVVVLPAFLKGKTYIILGAFGVVGSWLLLLVIYDYSNELINLIYSDRPSIHFSKLDYFRNFYRVGHITILASLYFVSLRSIQNTRRAKDAENRALILENALLRAQVNPHFIFNSLNVIKQSLFRNPGTAETTLLLLSDMMRYTFQPLGPDGMVDLGEEVQQLNRYFKMIKLQHDGYSVEFKVDLTGGKTVRLPPHLLSTLSENLYKHGDLFFTGKKQAQVSLKFKGNAFWFHTENEMRFDLEGKSQYIGLANTEARLEAFFLGRYKLITNTFHNRFHLDLFIEA